MKITETRRPRSKIDYVGGSSEAPVVGNALLTAGLTVDEASGAVMDARESAVDGLAGAIVESDFSVTGTVGTLREGAVEGLADAAVARDAALNGGVPTEGGAMRAVVATATGFADTVDGVVGLQTGRDIFGNEVSGYEAWSNTLIGGGTLGTLTLGPAGLGQKALVARAGRRAAAGGSTAAATRTTQSGIGVTRHGVQQKINRAVRSADELDAIKNPLDVRPVKVDKLGRPSQRSIGRKAEVVRNPETGNIISVNPTSTKKAERLLRRQGRQ